jgi:hypothetical protein
MPRQNREMATTAKGSAGSQRGTLCMLKGLTNAATAHAEPGRGAAQVGGPLVRVSREQTAVDAIGLGRALDPNVLNPVSAPMLGSRALPAVLREIVSQHVCRMSLLKDLRRTCRLDRTTRMHGNSRRAVVDTLGENFRVVPLVLAFQ